jgi:hypothetical protein
MHRTRLTVALILAVTITLTASATAQSERFLANAVAMGSVSGTARVEFTVERWTTDAERQEFLNILAEQGEGALVDALQQAGGVGRVRVNSRLSYPISYAFQYPGPDGSRRIVLATDRPVSAFEATNRLRTMDYSVSLAELSLPADGSGEGTLMVAALITLDEANSTLAIEHFGQAPVQLRNVRVR